jgi:hypothetical protein
MCAARWKYLRRADHSSRGVLPTVKRRVCDLGNFVSEEAIARVGLQRHMKKIYMYNFYVKPDISEVGPKHVAFWKQNIVLQ